MQTKQLQFYNIYADTLVQLKAKLLEQLHQLLNTLPQEDGDVPAEHLSCRIKSPESVCQKLKRRSLTPTPEIALQNLSDVIGIRVVMRFIGDVYHMADQIRKHTGWEVIRIKDYIAKPKPSGYRSLHMIVRVPFMCGLFSSIQVEIQLRTIAMDCWASLEHQMRYKKHIPNATLIGAELLRCAEEMASTDLTMQTIREMIRSNSSQDQE